LSMCLIFFQAQEDCLKGLTFVLTGVLDAFERDNVIDQIKRYGGKVTGSVSGKTSYVIVGREPGESKIAKVCPFCVFCCVYVVFLS